MGGKLTPGVEGFRNLSSVCGDAYLWVGKLQAQQRQVTEHPQARLFTPYHPSYTQANIQVHASSDTLV